MADVHNNKPLDDQGGLPQWNSQPRTRVHGLTHESGENSRLSTSSLPAVPAIGMLTGGGIGGLLSSDAALDARYVTELKRDLPVSLGVPGVGTVLSARANHLRTLETPEAADSGARVQAVGYLYGSYLMSKADPSLVETLCGRKPQDLGRKALTDALTNYAVNHLFNAENVSLLVAVLLGKEVQGQTTYTEKKLLSGILEPLAMGLERCAAGFPGSRLYVPRFRDKPLDPYLPRTPRVLRRCIDDAAATLLDSAQFETRTRRFLGMSCDHPALEAVLDTTEQETRLTNLKKFLLSGPILSDRDAKVIMECLAPPLRWGISTKEKDAESLGATLQGKANELIREHTGTRYRYQDFEPLDRAVILVAFALVDIVFNPLAFAGTREEAQKLLKNTYEWRSLTESCRGDIQATLDACYARALNR